jgi:hypothetical protein
VLKPAYKGKFLRDEYFKRRYYPERKDGQILYLDDQIYPKGYQEAHAILGHFRMNKYEELGWPFVTFVRDPIERVISQYFYHKGLLGNIPLREFVKLFPNHMAYMIGKDLSKLEFVGITEKYEESVARFKKQFEIKKPSKPTKRRRVNKRKKKVSEEDRRFIAKYNQTDIKLYKKALKRFKKG